MRIDAVVLSCEHGGNRVPARWAASFTGAGRLLASHRGWDRGALGVARRLARRLDAPLHRSTVTRLLVELNRSEDHPQLFSDRVRGLPAAERDLILARHWRPYRREVETAIRRRLARGRTVLHLSVHTFTPVLRGRRRDVDVGFLFDPARARERRLCERWRALLRQEAPRLAVRFNRPYLGSADGLTTTLRSRFPARLYLGIELEIGQRFFDAEGRPRSRVPALVEDSVVALVRGLRRGR